MNYDKDFTIKKEEGLIDDVKHQVWITHLQKTKKDHKNES